MIPLQVRAETSEHRDPFVVRLNYDWKPGLGIADAVLSERTDSRFVYTTGNGELTLEAPPGEEMDGDVLLVVSARKTARRLIRASSKHNTLLITERCDQLCTMCSQPPKAAHNDLFPYYRAATALAPENAVITLSGGEPTLFKDELFSLLEISTSRRPDLSLQVLTNAQHFEEGDSERLGALARHPILWGVPLYSTDPTGHDAIVQKPGAFRRLMKSFAIMGRSGSAIELRTVVMRDNVGELPRLAKYVGTHLPFVSRWAIMQLERIGFGRMNWAELFYDNSLGFEPIGHAIDLARSLGVETYLYNFPLCTVPAPYRPFAPATISDWKQRFLTICTDCPAKLRCGGFFQWYDEAKGFERLGLL